MSTRRHPTRNPWISEIHRVEITVYGRTLDSEDITVWDDSPPNDWWSKWVLGTAVPLLLSLHGVRCIVSGRAWLPSGRIRGSGRGIEVHGEAAFAFGVAVLAVAGLMHVHYLWNHVDRTAAYVNPALHAGLVLLVGAVVVLVWQVLAG